MAERKNFIIGLGETLRVDTDINTGGGDKKHPYTFDEAVKRLSGPLTQALSAIDSIPDDACPGDEAVISITLHPAYLAKSYNPAALFRAFGLRQIGSREAKVHIPDESEVLEDAKERLSVASELFVAGPRAALRRLDPQEGELQKSEALMNEFRKIEAVAAPGEERLKGTDLVGERIPLEIVLHIAGEADTSTAVVTGFEDWCNHLETVELREERQVGALSFWNVYANDTDIREILKFPFLRVARRMPKISFRAVALREEERLDPISISVPADDPFTDHVRVAIFDGGLPESHPFGGMARRLQAPGVGHAIPHGLEHGIQVTSAALFGPLMPGITPERPFSHVDHWQVIDGHGDDFDLTTTLDRITNVLMSEEYDVANLSLGPDDALVDSDVHIWTATLDEIASYNKTIIISAAGNNGAEVDQNGAAPGSDRIQPSSDGVNILAVGARDTLDSAWSRAPYSAKGPGRSPGLIKPDCVAMGGWQTSPFYAFSESGVASPTCGTSFASPTVARLAAGLKASYVELSPTAIRALLVHTSETDGNDQREVGWGSVQHIFSEIITCADDEATVVYQGDLGVQRQMRYPIPCPMSGFSRKVEITATFVIASPTDPEDSGSYTQVGAQIVFRPDTVSDPGFTSSGKPKAHPTKSFFGQSRMYQTEQELREDAHRWECVQKARVNFQASTLDHPVFDIEHLVRSHGGQGVRRASIPYALIVTLKERGNTSLHSDILSAYGSLRAMVPSIDVGIDV